MEPRMRIGIINYGMGNLGSVESAFRFLRIPTQIINCADELSSVDAFILPGVGSFGRAMDNLRKSAIPLPLSEEVIEKGKPILAICLGQHLLTQGSEESGGIAGLGWFDQEVTLVASDAQDCDDIRRPHVGWSSVTPKKTDHPLFTRLDQDDMFYFDHSYAVPPMQTETLATSSYFGDFSSITARGNILGVQFHPEKSQRSGLVLLRNFSNIALHASANKQS